MEKKDRTSPEQRVNEALEFFRKLQSERTLSAGGGSNPYAETPPNSTAEASPCLCQYLTTMAPADRLGISPGAVVLVCGFFGDSCCHAWVRETISWRTVWAGTSRERTKYAWKEVL